MQVQFMNEQKIHIMFTCNYLSFYYISWKQLRFPRASKYHNGIIPVTISVAARELIATKERVL